MLRPAPSATTRKRFSPSASMTRNVLRPMEPVDPRIETLVQLILCSQQGGGYHGLVGVEQVYSLPCFVWIRGASHAPLLSISIHQFDGSVDGLSCANHFQIDQRRATSILNVDASGYKQAEIFHLSNVLLQRLATLQEGPRLVGRIA